MKRKVNRKGVKKNAPMNNDNFRGIDLFEDYEIQEPKLRAIVNEINKAYDLNQINAKFFNARLKEAEALGYTFEMDMDGGAYGLRPIGVRLNELKGYEEYGGDEYAKGGETKKDKDAKYWLNVISNDEVYHLIENFLDVYEQSYASYLIDADSSFNTKDIKRYSEDVKQGFIELMKVDGDLRKLNYKLYEIFDSLAGYVGESQKSEENRIKRTIPKLEDVYKEILQKLQSAEQDIKYGSNGRIFNDEFEGQEEFSEYVSEIIEVVEIKIKYINNYQELMGMARNGMEVDDLKGGLKNYYVQVEYSGGGVSKLIVTDSYEEAEKFYYRAIEDMDSDEIDYAEFVAEFNNGEKEIIDFEYADAEYKSDDEYGGGGETPMARNGMNLNEWSASDVSNAKYVGIIEFEDNQGEFHNFEIMETEDRLVFGGMTNSGFIESGYIEKDGRSSDETLANLLEDLEVYYNDGEQYVSEIVVNQRMAKGGETSMARDGMIVTRDMGDYYEVYDDNSGKTLFIFALTEKEAEEISEEIDFDAFDDGDYISGYEVDTSQDEKYHYNEKRFFFMFKQIGEEDSFTHAQSWGYDYDDAEERARYENDLDEDEWELYSVNKMAYGGKFAEGGKFMRGGIAGDVYSLQNPEQFKQLITIYNDLSEKTNLIKGYYLDHTDNSIVFITTPNISDIGKDEIYGYVESLRSKGFSIINFKKTINTDKYENGLSWGTEKGAMIKQSGIDGRANPQWFKLFLIDRIKYDKGGSIAEGNYHMILSQAKQVKHHVDELQDILKKEDDIEAWVVAKMQDVSSNLSDVTHYLDGKSDMPMAKRGMKVKSDRLPTYTIKVDFLDKEDSNFYYDSMEEVFEFVGESATDSQKDKFEEDGYDMGNMFGGEYSTKLVSEIYIPRDERIKSKIVSYLNDKFGKGEVKVSVKESSDINTKMAKHGKYLGDAKYVIYDSEMKVVGDDLTEEDVIDYANNVWYYDMKDEDEEEIEDFDVAVDYLEQNEEYSVQRKLPQLLKKKIKRSRKK